MINITLAAVAMGVLFAVLGYRRGFYAIWAFLFNMIIAIYLSVMLTPTIAGYLPSLFPAGAKTSEGSFWYAYAGVAAAVAVVTFIILEVTALTYFTGTFNMSLPKLMENLGAAFIGFITGYILWGFICFLILIMPISQNLFLKSFSGDKQAMQQSAHLSMPAVSKLVNTVNAFSCQPNRKQVSNVIGWTIDIPEPNEIK